MPEFSVTVMKSGQLSAEQIVILLGVLGAVAVAAIWFFVGWGSVRSHIVPRLTGEPRSRAKKLWIALAFVLFFLMWGLSGHWALLNIILLPLFGFSIYKSAGRDFWRNIFSKKNK